MNGPRWSFALALLGIAAITVACGGGGGGAVGSNPPAVVAPASGHATLTIPNPTTASSSRRAQFISAASVGIAVNGGTPTFANVGVGSSLCTATGSARTCTIPLSATAGSATFTFTLYDAANGGGNVLGSGSTTQTVALGTPFTVAVVVNGMVASIALSVSPATLPVGTAGSATISVTAKDADGNTIIAPGNFNTPITLTDSDSSGATSISPATISAPGQTATLTYTGAPSINSSVTFGAQASGIQASAVTVSVLVFGAGSPTPTPTTTASGSASPASCGPALTLPGTYVTIFSFGTYSGTTYTAVTSANMSGWDSYAYTAGSTPTPTPTFTAGSTPTPGPSPTGTPQPVYIYVGTFQLQSGTSGCVTLLTSQDGSPLSSLSGSSSQSDSGFLAATPNVTGNYSLTFVSQGALNSMVVNGLSASGGSGTVSLSNGDSGTVTLTSRISTVEDVARKIQEMMLRH